MKTNKELKADFKLHKPIMGVFQIRNLVSDKIFIDSSTDVFAKWNRHQFQLKMGMHLSKNLQHDWTKLGAENFVFEMLSELKYNDEKQVDYKKELEVLQEMVLVDLASSSDKIYL